MCIYVLSFYWTFNVESLLHDINMRTGKAHIINILVQFVQYKFILQCTICTQRIVYMEICNALSRNLSKYCIGRISGAQ